MLNRVLFYLTGVRVAARRAWAIKPAAMAARWDSGVRGGARCGMAAGVLASGEGPGVDMTRLSSGWCI